MGRGLDYRRTKRHSHRPPRHPAIRSYQLTPAQALYARINLARLKREADKRRQEREAND